MSFPIDSWVKHRATGLRGQVKDVFRAWNHRTRTHETYAGELA